jgi:hypothetical protein
MIRVGWVVVILLLSNFVIAQENDSLPYRNFKDKIVWFGDVGYASAPFSIHYPFNDSVSKLKYRNNIRTVLGFGVSYKWFSLRLAASLPGYLKPYEKFGRTDQFNLNLDFTIKKVFYDIDLKALTGYSIVSADKWLDTLFDQTPNDIRRFQNSRNVSINAWYFHNPDFKMAALRGRTGNYKEKVQTWYIRTIFSVFAIGNEDSDNTVIPDVLAIPNHKTSSDLYFGLDLGAVPGFAYVNRFGNWQFGGNAGAGLALQYKSYSIGQTTRGISGIAPRYDIRLMGGYNVDKSFLMIITDFDNKSLRYTDLKMRQTYYSIRLAFGTRITPKEKNKKKSKKVKG